MARFRRKRVEVQYINEWGWDILGYTLLFDCSIEVKANRATPIVLKTKHKTYYSNEVKANSGLIMT